LHRLYDVILVSGYRVVGPAAVTAAKMLGKTCVLKADSRGEMSGEYFSNGITALGLERFSWLLRASLAVRNVILRRADAFVAVSAENTAELVEHGVNPNQIEHIPNSVDTTKFRPVDYETKTEIRCKLGILPNDLIVTYTGRLVSYKGLPLLLRVWRTIQDQHPNAKLVLVGEGGLDIHNCESVLRHYVSEHGLERSVRFTGSVRNVPEYLQASDIFVFPTENEAFPLALIEAMASGLPVVTTPVGGIPDVVSHGQNGLLVPPNNGERLGKAISELIVDKELSLRLGQAGRQAVEERYSTDTIVERYAALFDRIHGRQMRGSVVDSNGARG
jgi:glycosyltransferase involved in cell wall biosynthesis